MYSNFKGLNTSLSEVVMEKPDAMFYPKADNVLNDWRGFISNERPLVRNVQTDVEIVHVRYDQSAPIDPSLNGYADWSTPDREMASVIYLERDPDGNRASKVRAGKLIIPSSVDANLGRGEIYSLEIISPDPVQAVFSETGTFPVTTSEDRLVVHSVYVPEVGVLTAGGYIDITNFPPNLYGVPFRNNAYWNNRYSAINCAVYSNGRVGLASLYSSYGAQVNATVHFSRVNQPRVFSAEEAPGEPSVIRGFDLDLSAQFPSGYLSGIANFESDKMVFFSPEKAIMYRVDPDLTKWAIVQDVRIGIGTVSHNSICDVNGDLMYCSEIGVHTLRRSAMNGSVLYTLPLSQNVSDLYQSLLTKMPWQQRINAMYDRRTGTYNIFFPVSNEESHRLSLSITPAGNEGDPTVGSWSYSTFASPTCADYFSGNVLLGTNFGLYRMIPEQYGGMRGDGNVTLPLLWHGDMVNPKYSHSLVLIASGSGQIEVTAHDESGRELTNVVYDIPEDGITQDSRPLPRQFNRPFQHRYIGLRLSVKMISEQPLRIYGIGVNVKKDA
jgi:hypothetical protein